MSDFFGTSARAYLTLFTGAAVTSGSNAACSITITGVAAMRHYVVGVLWSYNGAPTGGRLTSTGLEGAEVDFDITTSGPGPLLTPPVVGERGSDVSFTLAAGGAGVVGKINVWYATVPA